MIYSNDLYTILDSIQSRISDVVAMLYDVDETTMARNKLTHLNYDIETVLYRLGVDKSENEQKCDCDCMNCKPLTVYDGQ